MHAAARHAVELGARHLEEWHALVGRDLHRLAHPIVGVDELLHVERGRGYAGSQGFDDRIASEQHVLGVLGAPRRRLGLRLVGSLGTPGCGMTGALARLRGGALALQSLATLTA